MFSELQGVADMLPTIHVQRRPSFMHQHVPRFPGNTIKEHAHDLFKDKVYSPDNWDEHISWRRHVPSPEVTFRVVLWYWPPLLFISCIGVFVCLYNRFAQPAGAPDITNGTYTSPFLLSSFALSLLLVFRTNSSYDRWWEARKLWGGLLATTRNLVMEVNTFGSPEAQALKDMFARWVIMLPFALRAHLTSEKDYKSDAEGILDEEEEEWLGKQHCLPVAVTQVLAELLNRMGMPVYMTAQAFEELAGYQRVLASCERLYRQPIPVAYTRHTSRFLIIWICTFPFALFHDFSWFTPVVGAVVGFLLIGVENIGIQIEQPFAVLPLTGMCKAMRDNVQAMRKSCPATQSFVKGLLIEEGLQALRASTAGMEAGDGRSKREGEGRGEGRGGEKGRGPAIRRVDPSGVPPQSPYSHMNGGEGTDSEKESDYEVPSERANGGRRRSTSFQLTRPPPGEKV